MIFIGVLLIGLMELCFDSTAPSMLRRCSPHGCATGPGHRVQHLDSAVGGTTPLIAQALISGTGNVMAPAYMLIFGGLVGAVTLLFTPEVAGKPLPGSGPAVESEQEARELADDVR